MSKLVYLSVAVYFVFLAQVFYDELVPGNELREDPVQLFTIEPSLPEFIEEPDYPSDELEDPPPSNDAEGALCV